MTVLVNPVLPKSVTVSTDLLTVTLFPCPEGLTVTEDVCILGKSDSIVKSLVPNSNIRSAFIKLEDNVTILYCGSVVFVPFPSIVKISTEEIFCGHKPKIQ